jgi:hypothetical protein
MVNVPYFSLIESYESLGLIASSNSDQWDYTVALKLMDLLDELTPKYQNFQKLKDKLIIKFGDPSPEDKNSYSISASSAKWREYVTEYNKILNESFTLKEENKVDFNSIPKDIKGLNPLQIRAVRNFLGYFIADKEITNEEKPS